MREAAAGSPRGARRRAVGAARLPGPPLSAPRWDPAWHPRGGRARSRGSEPACRRPRPLRPARATANFGDCERRAARPVLRSRGPGPGRDRGPKGGSSAPTWRAGSGGAQERRREAGGGPALRGRDLGAGTGEEGPRLHVCAAPASPGREFDFRVWPQVGAPRTQSPRKLAEGCRGCGQELSGQGRPPAQCFPSNSRTPCLPALEVAALTATHLPAALRRDPDYPLSVALGH